MSLSQTASPAPALQRPREFVRVVDGGEYGFYAEHVHAGGAATILTAPVEIDGLPYAHPLEEGAEQEAADYAYRHSLPCYFRHDPDGRWGALTVQQIEERQERIEALARARGEG